MGDSPDKKTGREFVQKNLHSWSTSRPTIEVMAGVGGLQGVSSVFLPQGPIPHGYSAAQKRWLLE